MTNMNRWGQLHLEVIRSLIFLISGEVLLVLVFIGIFRTNCSLQLTICDSENKIVGVVLSQRRRFIYL